jgi:hypothetical protein
LLEWSSGRHHGDAFVDSYPAFLPGLELSRLFYEEAVAPLLSAHFSGLAHAAARLDTGSEVLGFDTPRSMDHWWGPRVMLCLRSEDYTQVLADEIRRVLGAELPFEIHGFPTHMEEVDRATGTVFMARTHGRPINHMVSVTTAREFLSGYLGTHVLDTPLEPADWLAMPEQNLRTVASGGVWHDDIGELTRARDLLHWYPLDVWRYILAAEWRRIAQEEAFPGRCVEAGDELGSRVVAARLVRELMHLAFLLERQYMPYSKWLGTAFARLQCSAVLQPILLSVLAATDWAERERWLSAAYEIVAALQNGLALAQPVPDRVSPFFGRPFQVIHGDQFATALLAAVADETVKQLPRHLGNTTQWVDSTDVLSYPVWVSPLRNLYAANERASQ